MGRTTKGKRKEVTMKVKARAADLSIRTTRRKVAAVTMLVKARMKAADLSTRTTKTKRKENQKTTAITKEEMKTKKKNLRTWTTKTKRETRKKNPRTTQKMKRKAKITGLAARMGMART